MPVPDSALTGLMLLAAEDPPIGPTTQTVIGITYLAVQICGIAAAVDAIMRGRTAQGAAAWSLGLVMFPLVAIPLYLVLGDRRFAGYVRARRKGNRGIDKVATELFEKITPFRTARRQTPADYLALERLARLPFTSGNQVEFLIDGEATFDAIFTAIHNAKEYLLIQFYIIRDDGLGQRFQRALLDARERGVAVHLLYDEIGSYSLPSGYLNTLTAAGCKCGGFRTKKRRQRPFRINFRNHRKIIVADGAVALVGGLNVGDEYLGLQAEMSPWRDTHVRLRGPSVQGVQLSFVEDWYWVHHAVPKLNWDPAVAPDADTLALVVPSGPADELETCGLLFTHIANSARQRLWIATPYFVPDEQMLGALQLASLRGVDVRVIIPERTDARMVWLSAFSYYDDVLPTGIKLYRYQPGFMHQKVVLCDELACVGTANLDNRSFRINFEITVVVADAEFAEKTRSMLEDDLKRCREVKKGELEQMRWAFRLASRVSRLLAPIQ